MWILPLINYKLWTSFSKIQIFFHHLQKEANKTNYTILLWPLNVTEWKEHSAWHIVSIQHQEKHGRSHTMHNLVSYFDMHGYD